MRKWELAAAVLGVATCLLSAGCGETKESEKRTTPSAAQIRKAEEVVRDELPAIPLWEKATFRGVATEVGDVCVDRLLARRSAALLGGHGASHVVVAIPDMTTGKAQDGTCKR